jgi:hypothetical protein
MYLHAVAVYHMLMAVYLLECCHVSTCTWLCIHVQNLVMCMGQVAEFDCAL